MTLALPCLGDKSRYFRDEEDAEAERRHLYAMIKRERETRFTCGRHWLSSSRLFGCRPNAPNDEAAAWGQI